MADYGSMKVPELKKLLTERGLPHTGNKADLIARLTENDKQLAADKAEPQTDSKKQSAAEDEIDYEDDDFPATKKATAGAVPGETAAAPAKTKAEAAPAEATTAEANDAAAAVATTTDAKSAADNIKAGVTTEPPPAEPAFTQNLPPTNAKTEAEKRAARAARFGITTDADSEEAKKAERAARFGVANDQVSALDSALPDRPRKRGRGAAEGENAKEEESGRANKRSNRGGRTQQQQQQQPQQHRRGQGGRRQGGGGGGNVQKGGGGGGKTAAAGRAATDSAEKAKMEARAKRFATAAAAAAASS